MESVQLSEFYRSVTQCPRTEQDLVAVSEKVARLLEAPFAAAFSSDSGEKLGYKFLGPSGGTPPGTDPRVFHDFLVRQIRHASSVTGFAGGNGAQLRHIQLSRESLPWSGISEVNHLAIASFSGELKGNGSAGAVVQGKREGGWLLVGTTKPLNSKEEVLLLACAQKLSELYKVSSLESAIQLRNQFLSIASHELKTPLTSIYGILQLQDRMAKVKRDEPPEAQEERKQSFQKIVIRQVERLNELIDGLLDVSRIQGGRFAVEPTDTDVAILLRETIGGRINVIAQEASVRIEVEAPDHLMSWVDPVRMEEVITNLSMNAIRFSPEGGVVRTILQGDSDSFRLIVRDQGPAVPMEDRERIFQPFERAQRTSRLGGLGLGLFISRQIAQLHGGNVSLVESIPGKGNVFEARFPMRNINLVSA